MPMTAPITADVGQARRPAWLVLSEECEAKTLRGDATRPVMSPR